MTIEHVIEYFKSTKMREVRELGPYLLMSLTKLGTVINVDRQSTNLIIKDKEYQVIFTKSNDLLTISTVDSSTGSIVKHVPDLITVWSDAAERSFSDHIKLLYNQSSTSEVTKEDQPYLKFEKKVFNQNGKAKVVDPRLASIMDGYSLMIIHCDNPDDGYNVADYIASNSKLRRSSYWVNVLDSGTSISRIASKLRDYKRVIVVTKLTVEELLPEGIEDSPVQPLVFELGCRSPYTESKIQEYTSVSLA